ncbi:hypothetical protein GOODEAATRI_003863 [Goodea atripinnis]|uniref:Transposase n=1 Tax=Goodea atripinnis TaxID=208336 RepID=A0ABV0NH93_9TELE
MQKQGLSYGSIAAKLGDRKTSHFKFPRRSNSPLLSRNTDDFKVVRCFRGEENEMDHFVTWCGNNLLILNVNRPKEMIVDFRRNTILSWEEYKCSSGQQTRLEKKQ